MSTMDDIKEIRDILYKIGMLETMCFSLTGPDEHWSIRDYCIFYSVTRPSMKYKIMVDYWRI